jgi:hypothetical protein
VNYSVTTKIEAILIDRNLGKTQEGKNGCPIPIRRFVAFFSFDTREGLPYLEIACSTR